MSKFALAAWVCSVCAACGEPGACTDPLEDGWEVLTGDAEFYEVGDALVVIQKSRELSLKWPKFEIPQGRSLHCVQPDDNALLVIQAGEGALIGGLLEADGTACVTSPTGLVIGPGGVIRCRGFATFAPDWAETEQRDRLKIPIRGKPAAFVENCGTIECPGGDIWLSAARVFSSGKIDVSDRTINGLGARCESAARRSRWAVDRPWTPPEILAAV